MFKALCTTFSLPFISCHDVSPSLTLDCCFIYSCWEGTKVGCLVTEYRGRLGRQNISSCRTGLRLRETFHRVLVSPHPSPWLTGWFMFICGANEQQGNSLRTASVDWVSRLKPLIAEPGSLGYLKTPLHFSHFLFSLQKVLYRTSMSGIH